MPGYRLPLCSGSAGWMPRTPGLACTSAIFGVIALCAAASRTHGSMTLLPTSSCSHTGNLVTNGSFEIGAPPPGFGNEVYWATGTTLTPFGVPPGWSSSGAPNTYASWGADSGTPYRIKQSDVLPDGQIGMYFGNGASATTSLPPTFNPNGTVTFPGTPVMTPGPGFTQAARLSQGVPTHLNLAPNYCFSFWASGEFASMQGGTPDGIFGLRVTNVLPGDPVQFFTVPGGFGPLGMSHQYHFDLVPLNPLVPISIEFINWGHFDLTAYGSHPFTTELVLDDVMINAIPEPASLLLLVLGGLLIKRQSLSHESNRITSFLKGEVR